jgi:two-component system response regulator HydG
MTEPHLARILIADDEPLFLRTTAELLRKAGYACTCVSHGPAALEALASEPFDLILSDLNMPGNLRLELLREGRAQWPHIPLIVVTGAPSLPSAIESVRLGIADYLLKPVKYEDLLSSVGRVLRQQRARPISFETSDRTQRSFHARFPEIIGESPAMQEVFEVMDRVADTDANVLITGESGTGKEVVAHAIHRHSRRGDRTFQVIDCTAIPETLFESTLFGHAKGAFTGAVKDQPGLLSQCDGGGVFFDEIGELPATLQAKMLRLIQEQTFTPVGKTAPLRVDVRFLCATNRDLELEVTAGRFRRDLFYRLAVIHLELPPLRKRGDDVLLLAAHFLQALQKPDRRVQRFSEEARSLLRAYAWPGNIRELRNVVERGLALARGDMITPEDLPPALRRAASATGASAKPARSAASREEALDLAEREYLIALLRDNGGNVARCSRQAGMSRQGFHGLLKRHGIVADDFRA